MKKLAWNIVPHQFLRNNKPYYTYGGNLVTNHNSTLNNFSRHLITQQILT